MVHVGFVSLRSVRRTKMFYQDLIVHWLFRGWTQTTNCQFPGRLFNMVSEFVELGGAFCSTLTTTTLL